VTREWKIKIEGDNRSLKQVDVILPMNPGLNQVALDICLQSENSLYLHGFQQLNGESLSLNLYSLEKNSWVGRVFILTTGSELETEALRAIDFRRVNKSNNIFSLATSESFYQFVQQIMVELQSSESVSRVVSQSPKPMLVDVFFGFSQERMFFKETNQLKFRSLLSELIKKNDFGVTLDLAADTTSSNHPLEVEVLIDLSMGCQRPLNSRIAKILSLEGLIDNLQLPIQERDLALLIIDGLKGLFSSHPWEISKYQKSIYVL